MDEEHEPFDYLVYSFGSYPSPELERIKHALDNPPPGTSQSDIDRAVRRSEAIAAVLQSREDQDRFRYAIFAPVPAEVMTPSKVLDMLVAAPTSEWPKIAEHLRERGGFRGTDEEVVAQHRREIALQIN